MVEVEVAHDDGFDVLDVVAGGFDGAWELYPRCRRCVGRDR